MPKPWEIASITSFFSYVVSLATPSEHAGMGYDPRSLVSMGGVEFLWKPIPRFNALTLGELARLITFIEDAVGKGRVLIHSLRGCGRVAMVTASYLVHTGLSLPEAITDTSRAAGCGLESKPQFMAVRGYTASLRFGFKDLLSRLDRVESMVVEYTTVLAMELSPYTSISSEIVHSGINETLKLMNRSLLNDKAVANDNGLGMLVAAIISEMGYSVVELKARLRPNPTLYIEAWIERETHPQRAHTPTPNIGHILGAWRRLVDLMKLGDPDKAKIELKTYEPFKPPILQSL